MKKEKRFCNKVTKFMAEIFGKPGHSKKESWR
jgi:hypothetical protein